MKITGFFKDPANISYSLYQSFWTGLDWLFPPECGGCGEKGFRWCDSCREKLSPFGSTICTVCGKPLNSRQICYRCKLIHPSYDCLRSVAEFKGPLRKALHRLKYKHDLGLGDIFSKYLINLLNEFGLPIDLILPVPLSKERLALRGYNQAAILARPVSMSQKINYSSKGLFRIRETRSQVGLSYGQRKENVEGAFSADPRIVSGKNLLIIDDITTTGATIEACANVLKIAGAEQVFAITLARAVLEGDISDPISVLSTGGVD
jgi:competence protein ComFC